MLYYNAFGGPYYAAERPLEPPPEREGALDPTDNRVQNDFINEDILDFMDFVREEYPQAIPDYLSQYTEQFREFCGL